MCSERFPITSPLSLPCPLSSVWTWESVAAMDVSDYATTLQDDFEIEEEGGLIQEHVRHAPPEVE